MKTIDRANSVPDIVHHRQYSIIMALLVQLHPRVHYHIISQVMVKCTRCERLLFSYFFSITSKKTRRKNFNGLIFLTAVLMGFYSFSCLKDPANKWTWLCLWRNYMQISGAFRLVPPRKLIIYLFGFFFVCVDVHTKKCLRVERETRAVLLLSHLVPTCSNSISKIQIQRLNYHVRHFVRVVEKKKKSCI